MAQINDIIAAMRQNPYDVRFADLKKVCTCYFGEARQSKTSHLVYKTKWQGDPRVNIQEGKNGKAKLYQVRQVLDALDKLENISKSPNADSCEYKEGY
ncbi:MAG: toxin HicA [Symploca sp. SIO1B1]|nr:toxin HicA [Symploca sp. SIO1B1]